MAASTGEQIEEGAFGAPMANVARPGVAASMAGQVEENALKASVVDMV